MKSVFENVTSEPCRICLELYQRNEIQYEAIMPLPKFPAISVYRRGEKVCSDCQSAETMIKMKMLPTFEMARLAVANERVEHLRLQKGISEHMGLMLSKLVKPCSIDDLKRHQGWLKSLEIELPVDEDDD